MNEILSIDFDVKTGKLKKWLWEARDDISWFQKRIESDEGITLSLNKAKVQKDLEEVRNLIKIEKERIAQGIGNEWVLLQLMGDQNIVKQRLTQANREFTNFLRTGEKDISVLGKLFTSLEWKIEWVEMELIKMWRSEKEVWHLRARMNELKNSFDNGRISAQQMAMEMNNLEREMNAVKNAPQGFQEKMSFAYGKVMGYIALITAAVYWLKSAFDEALEGERIDINLTRRLWGIWVSVWRTKEQIKEFSSTLSDATSIDEDAIVNMQSRLLQFQAIQWDTFDRAWKAVVDYATNLADWAIPNMDQLNKSADELWVILNNPEKWFIKLTKAWAIFTQEEVNMFNEFKKTNNMIWMQDILLQKLENQYGWSAEEMANTTQWAISEMSNWWNDFMEFLGVTLLMKLPLIIRGMVDSAIIILWTLYEAFTYLPRLVIEIWANIKLNWSKIWSGILQVWENSVDNFWIIWSNIYEALSSWFSKIPWKFKEYWNKIIDFLPESVKDTLGFEGFTLDTTSVSAKIKALKPIIWDAFEAVEFKLSTNFKDNLKNNNLLMAWVSDLRKTADIYNRIWDAQVKIRWKWLDLWDIWDTGSWGRGWKNGKSPREIQLEAEKKRLDESKKKEEEVAKARTEAYAKAQKSSEAFRNVIADTNKKLEEMKGKWKDLASKATEALKDIEDAMSWNKGDFKDKLAKRYMAIGEEIKSAFWLSWTWEEATNLLLSWSLNIQGDALKNELIMIKKQMSWEEISLAIAKEKRSETEKITAEYQKQLDIDTRSKQVAEATLAKRFLSNPTTWELQFFDANGNIIEWANRSQQKDFASQALDIQKLADEELRINDDKMTKIASIVKEYEEERARLRNNYYSEDKNLRIVQENMAQKFFENDIARMKAQTVEATNLATALMNLSRAWWGNVTNVNTTNNVGGSTTNQTVQVKTVADVAQINKSLGIGITLKK